MASSYDSASHSGGARRGWFISTMTVLFLILAFSNFTKAFQHINDPTKGLVVLGYRIVSTGANAVAGPLFGLFLVAYAFGLWRMKRWVLPLSIAYAFYVPVNLVLFWFLHTDGRPSLRFIAVYLFISLVGSIGTAICLAWRQAELG